MKKFTRSLRSLRSLRSPLSILAILVIMVILVIFLIHQSRGSVTVRQTIEPFYTLFIPYYQETIPLKSVLYDKNISNDNLVKFNYNYRPIRIGVSLEFTSDTKFVKFFTRVLLAYSNIINVKIISLRNSREICYKVNKNEIDIGIASTPIVLEALTGDRRLFNGKKLNNLQFLCSIGDRYLFAITTKTAQIENLRDIKNKTVSMNVPYSTSWKFANQIVESLGYQPNRDFKAVYIDAKRSLNLLVDNQIDLFFFVGFYPDKFLYDALLNDTSSSIRILPISGFNNEIFTTQYFYYTKTSIDLYKMPQQYLPVAIGDVKYTQYNPNLYTYKFSNILICNNKLSSEVAYKILETIFLKVGLFNKLDIFRDNNLNTFDMSWSKIFLPMNLGAQRFYTKQGYRNTLDNPNCALLAGRMECTEKNLQRNGLLVEGSTFRP